jgi:perosamine synthetase
MVAFRRLSPAAPYLNVQGTIAGIQGMSGNALTTEAFATEIARYFDAEAAFLALSGRAALYLLLETLSQQVPARREVVLPAYTCPSILWAIRKAQLEPCLCDVNPQTLGLDGDQLPRLVTRRTLAIIPVHLFGIPQEIEIVMTLAKHTGAVVIEDVAQAMGARFKDRRSGNWGHYGLVSLGPGKGLSTGGGGAVLVNDGEGIEAISQTWQNLPPCSSAKSALWLLRIVGSAIICWPHFWWLISQLGISRARERQSDQNSRLQRLSTVQAAIGKNLLSQLDAVNADRQRRAIKLINALASISCIRFPKVSKEAESIYLRLPMLVKKEKQREQLFKALQTAGIGVSKMYRQPLHRRFPNLAERNYCGATTLARQLLTLPTHHFVKDRDIERIVTIVRRTLS